MARRGPAPRISDVIVTRIQRQISSGRLATGARLPAEREMARRHKTSRICIREAYRSLQELGVLNIRRGAEGGAFVSEVDHGTVQRSLSMVLRLGRVSHQELTEARVMIEPPLARLAARRATPEDLGRLKAVLDHQETRLARRGSYRPSNLAFHRAVAECAHNLPLATMMNSLADLTIELVTKIDVAREVQEGNCGAHRQIFDAIERHDEETASLLMLQHIGTIQGEIRESLARHLEAGAKKAGHRRTHTADPFAANCP